MNASYPPTLLRRICMTCNPIYTPFSHATLRSKQGIAFFGLFLNCMMNLGFGNLGEMAVIVEQKFVRAAAAVEAEERCRSAYSLRAGGGLQRLYVCEYWQRLRVGRAGGRRCGSLCMCMCILQCPRVITMMLCTL